MKNKILFTLMSTAVIGGLFLLSLAVYCEVSFMNTGNGEYLEGVGLGVVMSLPFWLAVSALSYGLKTELSKRLYLILNMPAPLLCLIIVIHDVISIYT